MDEKERLDRRKLEMDELYRAIGEFVVAFELICNSVQTCILILLEDAGLRKYRASEIIVAGLTAEPLRSLFESLMGELVQMSDAERKIIKNALNRFQKLTLVRNDIIHSTWYIGWGNESTTDFSEARGRKFHKDQHGAVTKSFKRKAADFAIVSAEAKALSDIFRRLNGCFTGPFSIEKNFIVSKQGQVSVPPGSVQ